MSRNLRYVIALTFAAIASLTLFAACSSDGDDGSSPAPGTSEPPGGTPTAFDFPDTPFGGARDRIEETFSFRLDRPPTLESVTMTDSGPFDRLEFHFDFGVPDYSVEYVEGPIAACGSGLPVEIAGTSFLQIRLQGTAAHNDAGEPTITNDDEVLNFPTLLQATMTCDFEGEVTWVLGLSEEVNFRALAITTPFPQHFINVDVNHPGRD